MNQTHEMILPICIQCHKEPFIFLPQDGPYREEDDGVIWGFNLSYQYMPEGDASAQQGAHNQLRHPGQPEQFILLYKYVLHTGGVMSVEYTGTEKQDPESFSEDQPEESAEDPLVLSVERSTFHFHKAEVILGTTRTVFPDDPGSYEIFKAISTEQARTLPPQLSRQGVIFQDQRLRIVQFRPRLQSK